MPQLRSHFEITPFWCVCVCVCARARALVFVSVCLCVTSSSPERKIAGSSKVMLSLQQAASRPPPRYIFATIFSCCTAREHDAVMCTCVLRFRFSVLEWMSAYLKTTRTQRTGLFSSCVCCGFFVFGHECTHGPHDEAVHDQ